jgi:hypothetical protein
MGSTFLKMFPDFRLSGTCPAPQDATQSGSKTIDMDGSRKFSTGRQGEEQ